MAPLLRRLNRAVPGRPAVEQRVHDAGAARIGEKARAKADQAARRHGELQAHPARAGRGVILVILPLRMAEQLRDHADKVFWNVDDEQLHGLVQLAVDLARDDRGLATPSARSLRGAWSR